MAKKWKQAPSNVCFYSMLAIQIIDVRKTWEGGSAEKRVDQAHVGRDWWQQDPSDPNLLPGPDLPIWN